MTEPTLDQLTCDRFLRFISGATPADVNIYVGIKDENSIPMNI